MVLDELGYLPFARSGGQLLFHLVSKLYEQTSVLREVGAAVSLSANATRFYDQRFGLAEPLGAVSAEVDGLIFRDGRTGERIARLSSHDEYRRRFGASFLGIHRADLQSILFSALDPDSLHLAKRVVQIDGSATQPSCTSPTGTQPRPTWSSAPTARAPCAPSSRSASSPSAPPPTRPA